MECQKAKLNDLQSWSFLSVLIFLRNIQLERKKILFFHHKGGQPLKFSLCSSQCGLVSCTEFSLKPTNKRMYCCTQVTFNWGPFFLLPSLDLKCFKMLQNQDLIFAAAECRFSLRFLGKHHLKMNVTVGPRSIWELC